MQFKRAWESLEFLISQHCANFHHGLVQQFLHEVHKQATNFSYRDTGRVSTIAIDSTGFPTEYFSYYYSMRTEKTRKDFIKISLAVDTEKQTILGAKITKSRQHDTKHAKPLLRNTLKKAECYVLDRGYDSEQIHLQIRTEIHAKSIIPIRDWNADYVKGEFRNEMANNFDRERYGQRNKLKLFSLLLNEDLEMKLKRDYSEIRSKN